MKRSTSAGSFLPEIDLSIDHPVCFREHEAKRMRLSSEDSSFFSISYSKKVQNPESLVPTLLTVNGGENCSLEVNDETNRRLVCEGSRLEENEVDCFLYFDNVTKEFVVTEVDENYIFGEAHDPNAMEFDDGGLGAEFEAAILQSASPPQQRVAPRPSCQKAASPRIVNGHGGFSSKLVNGSSKARKPESVAKVSPAKAMAKPVLREESAPKPAAKAEPSSKASVKEASPKAPVAPKAVITKTTSKPVPVVAPRSPVKPAPVVVAKPPSPKAPSPKIPSPKATLSIADEEDFDLMDMIGQDADSEPEKPSEANLFDFDDEFEEVKTDSEAEPEPKAQPIVQAKVKPASPKRPLVRKNPPAKKAAHSSSGSSGSSSSGSSSSGSDSSSSGSDSGSSGSSSSGSSSSSDSDSDSDSNKKKAKQTIKKAPAPKALPAKSPTPDQASFFDEDDLFNFENHDSDKQDGFDFGNAINAVSDEEFKGGDPITNADLPTTDEDEPAPKSKPPPKEELNSSDYSSDNDQRYAKVDLALIEDDHFDLV
ncbi:hypothetical protein DSO57_1026689 [Entomophthora muscae]|nr:hypothetical protein DSO57_1026689 [Entomophthora muscae]